MSEVNRIIEYINEKRRVSLEELRSSFGVKVRSIDLKKKSIVIDL
jgi:predicted DNA-binding transcriptional regulator YafY